ncbi:MAG: formate dehydrogenase accessory sulfurtransferase FdhD [Candidatus Thorarchaeota archaeon]|jgi:FdhD protein
MAASVVVGVAEGVVIYDFITQIDSLRVHSIAVVSLIVLVVLVLYSCIPILANNAFRSSTEKTSGHIMKPYMKFSSTKYEGEESTTCDDLVAIESVLELRLDNEFIAAFVCTPGQERQLAVGYLISSGIISSPVDIDQIVYRNKLCNVKLKKGVTIRSGKGFSQIRRFVGTECSAPEMLQELRTGGDIPTLTGSVDIPLSTLFETSANLRNHQPIHQKTHGTHAAVLTKISENLSVSAEDIGRHSAVDKTIGLALEADVDLTKSFLFCTGRLTADVVSKAAWSSIPLVASHSVATDAGIRYAKKANITILAGFRHKRFWKYHAGVGVITH